MSKSSKQEDACRKKSLKNRAKELRRWRGSGHRLHVATVFLSQSKTPTQSLVFLHRELSLHSLLIQCVVYSAVLSIRDPRYSLALLSFPCFHSSEPLMEAEASVCVWQRT